MAQPLSNHKVSIPLDCQIVVGADKSIKNKLNLIQLILTVYQWTIKTSAATVCCSLETHWHCARYLLIYNLLHMWWRSIHVDQWNLCWFRNWIKPITSINNKKYQKRNSKLTLTDIRYTFFFLLLPPSKATLKWFYFQGILFNPDTKLTLLTLLTLLTSLLTPLLTLLTLLTSLLTLLTSLLTHY